MADNELNRARNALLASFDQTAADALEEARQMVEAGMVMPVLRGWQAAVEAAVRAGDGIALVFARTETEMFHRWVWERAAALLFLEGRLHFHDLAGRRARHNAGGPSALVAYGAANARVLRGAKVRGKYVALEKPA